MSYILIILMFGCILMLIRNQLVFKCRTEMLKNISSIAKKNINENKEWRHLYDNFEKTTYDHLLFSSGWWWGVDDNGNIYKKF